MGWGSRVLKPENNLQTYPWEGKGWGKGGFTRSSGFSSRVQVQKLFFMQGLRCFFRKPSLHSAAFRPATSRPALVVPSNTGSRRHESWNGIAAQRAAAVSGSMQALFGCLPVHGIKISRTAAVDVTAPMTRILSALTSPLLPPCRWAGAEEAALHLKAILGNLPLSRRAGQFQSIQTEGFTWQTQVRTIYRLTAGLQHPLQHSKTHNPQVVSVHGHLEITNADLSSLTA